MACHSRSRERVNGSQRPCASLTAMTAALVDWPSLAADRFPYPAHIPASRLVDELAVALVSRDPGVRDDGVVAELLRLPYYWLA